MPHNSEKEEKLQSIDQKKGYEKKVETGEGKGGQPAKKSIRSERNPEHFCRKSQTRAELPIAGVENGKGESDGDRPDGDEEQKN
jgi:hypothetical protein